MLAEAAAHPDDPASVQTLKVQRSAQWLADHFEDVPLFLFPFCQHDPTGGSIYPAVWSAMLAACAVGVGSCLTAVLQFFHPTETLDPRGAGRPGLDPLGHGELRLSHGHLGRRGKDPPSIAFLPELLGRRRRIRGARTAVAGLTNIAVPFAGTVLKLAIAPGDAVGVGSVLVVQESMKMQHIVEAEVAGVIESVRVAVGDAVQSGDVLLSLRPSEGTESAVVVEERTEREGGIRRSWSS